MFGEWRNVNPAIWNIDRDRIYTDSEIGDMMRKAYEFGFTEKDTHFRGMTFEELEALVTWKQ